MNISKNKLSLMIVAILLVINSFQPSIVEASPVIQADAPPRNDQESPPIQDIQPIDKNIGDKSIVREIPEKRTRNSKHYLLQDGTYKAVITSYDQHYLTVDNKFEDIDLTLINEDQLSKVNLQKLSKEFVLADEIKMRSAAETEMNSTNKEISPKARFFRTPKIPYDTRIPENFSKGYTVSHSGDSVTFLPLNANSVTGSVYSNRTEYINVWHSTDVTLEVLPEGVKETIILKDASAPTIFTFEVKSNKPIDENLTIGSLKIRPAWLVDANDTFRPVEQTLYMEKNKTYIRLTADTTDLQFPIKIDPTTTTFSAVQDAYLNHYGYYGDFYDIVVGNWSHEYREDTKYDAYIQFDLSSIPSQSKIYYAYMRLMTLSHYVQGGDVPQYVSRITSTWSEDTITYNTRPTTDYLNTIVEYATRDPGEWEGFDLTQFAQLWINGTPNYGVVIAGSPSGYTGKTYASSEYDIIAHRPKLEVNYDSAPMKPTVVSPNGGEVIDTTYTIVWTPATDADNTQNTLRYQIQYSGNGGQSWSTIVNLTSAGATSYTYNFSSTANTTNALIRIRAYDGVNYGPWDNSDRPFTIRHNSPPNAPSGLNPGSTSSSTPTIVNSVTPSLSWTFTDPDSGDTQSAYQVVIQTSTGTAVHDTGWVNSSNKSFTVASNKLTRGTAYRWQVRVKDNKGAISAYSSFMYIKPNQLPVATITSYTDGQQVSDNILTFTWTYTDPDGHTQTKYQIQGSQDNFATISYNSGEISSSATTHTTSPLGDGTWSFRLRVFDGREWSAWNNRNNLVLPNSYEPNDTNTTAFPILMNTNYSTYIGSASDVDFYTYQAAHTGIDELTLTVPSDKNYDVYIYDQNMKFLASGLGTTGDTEKVIFKVSQGQRIYVKVVGVNGHYSTTATYTLRVSQYSLNTTIQYQYDNNGNLIGSIIMSN